jgi:hypothetical protein
MGSTSITYIESTLADVDLASQLANEVMGRRLRDLLPQTQKCLHLIHDMVCQQMAVENSPQEEIRFTRKEFSVFTHHQFGTTQLKTHLRHLVEQEYLVLHLRQRGQPFVYECLYRGEGMDDQPFLLGLNQAHLAKSVNIPITPQKVGPTVGVVEDRPPLDQPLQTIEKTSPQQTSTNPSHQNN